MTGIESYCKGIEKFHDSLRYPGYIPVVSTLTGTIRIIAGIAGTILTGFAALFALGINKEDAKKLGESATFQLCCVLRGGLEVIPIAGNISCISLDFFLELGKGIGQAFGCPI